MRTTMALRPLETGFTEDLKIIDVPALVMHGDDDQIVPISRRTQPLPAKLLKNSTLKVYPKFPHGMCTTHAWSSGGPPTSWLSSILNALSYGFATHAPGSGAGQLRAMGNATRPSTQQ